jgi:bla regulator protein BlaR1
MSLCIIKLETRSEKVLYGKTGSGFSFPGFDFKTSDKNVNGWFIGFVEAIGNVYYFATNIEAEENATGQKAKNITLAVFEDLNIY